jgi:hypothetical protein
MKIRKQTILLLSTACCTIAASLGFLVPKAQSDAPQSESPNSTLIYFLRHGEDVPELVGSDPSFTVTFNLCNAEGSCCVEALNPLGKMRASLLADWFEEKQITRTLTHVLASHKLRTRQTVEKIAQAAGLGGDLNGDGIPDGTDVDQAPGDGVINVPPFPEECTPGWTSSSSVIQPQTNYLSTLPLGSRAVLCSHSPALYPVMQAFGIDTSDPVKFPKDTKGRVKGFNNLWIVELKPVAVGGTVVYRGRLLEHILLDMRLEPSLIDRDHGNQPSHPAMDDEE